MDEFWYNILKFIMSNNLCISIAIIIIGLVIYYIISKSIDHILERDKKHQRIDNKGKTVFKLFNNVVKYIIIAIVIVLILQVYGVDVSSLVAGLGIVSVVVGLAVQDPLKDIISGVNIISDDYYALGDVLKIDDIEGKVIQLGIRTTKIKEIKSGNIYVIANRNISKVSKISNELYIDVPLSYENDLKMLEILLTQICQKIEKLENVRECKYVGINEFASSSMIAKIKIICNPELRLIVKRAANRIIKLELDKNGISIPYPQLTIHNG